MRAIVAMDPQRVIGHHGKIPWHIPEDFKFFKKMTMGHPLVMGRGTFDSLGGKPLPGRHTYVLTTDPFKLTLPAGELCEYITTDGLINKFNRDLGWQMQWDEIWVCGGAKVYNEFMPWIHELYVTHIADEYEGDTYMPAFEQLFPKWSIVKEAKDFMIAKYERNLTWPSFELDTL